jgi:CheY-like chemotaxis protein
LLLAALDEVSANVLENPAQVYLYATNRLLLRNIDTKRTFTITADKLYFLCELAWEMIQSGELRIHYTEIPERIKTYFGDRIKDQHELDTWDFDLRNQTLLHRDAAGYYEFAHKSLAEYFVAFKFVAEMDCLAPVFTQTYCEADGQPCQLPIAQKDPATISNLPPLSGDLAVLSFIEGMVSKDYVASWNASKHLKHEYRADIVYMDPYGSGGWFNLMEVAAKEMGLHCITTSSALSAFLIILMTSPRFLITDLYVTPDEYPAVGSDWRWDGMTLARTIYRLDLDIIVIAFTAVAEIDRIREGFRVGMYDFLSKHKSSVKELRTVLAEALKSYRSR